MKRGVWLLILAFPLFAGCHGYFKSKPRPSVLPDYIHKIAVRPFSNHTQQYGLEDKLTLATQTEFNRDGRYQISTENQADGVLIGDITKYILEPLSYDSNHVPTEYKLTILTTISFEDKVKAQTLWTDPTMAGELRYFVASSGLAGSMTEDDARQTIYDQLSRDIATRTFEGFGAPTGSSAAVQGSSSTLTTPAAIDNNPPPQPSTEPSEPSRMRQPY